MAKNGYHTKGKASQSAFESFPLKQTNDLYEEQSAWM